MMETVKTVLSNTFVTKFRHLFYLVSPNETSFETVQEVPEYVVQAAPYFLICLLLENCIWLATTGKAIIRTNDGFSSIALGLMSMLHGMLLTGPEIAAYLWVHQRFCLYELPWDSPWTWVVAFFLQDLTYYWVHRLGHEVNIFWAGHQTHHSSEDYNLSTALRQSMIHKYFTWMFYLPMALFLPPTQMLVHFQFNLLYQFWIHTELVNKLGPLEYILNTPSHHRVHHGRNPYCIDKNYGGTLIIWDRMFGTFIPEKERVVYGLVHPLQTWDPIHAQFGHLIYMLKTAWQLRGWQNKLSVFVKGPGWEPGKPRLGLPEDIPEIEDTVQKYNSGLPWWGNIYVLVHFLLIAGAQSVFSLHKTVIGPVNIIIFIIFGLFSLTTFGALFDNKTYAPALEFIRCLICLAMVQMYQPITVKLSAGLMVFYLLFSASALLWGYLTLSKFQLRVYKKKVL